MLSRLVLGAWLAFLGLLFTLTGDSAPAIGFGVFVMIGGVAVAARGRRVSVECDREFGLVHVCNPVRTLDIPMQSVTRIRTQVGPSTWNHITRRRTLVIEFQPGRKVTVIATDGMSIEEMRALAECIAADTGVPIDV